MVAKPKHRYKKAAARYPVSAERITAEPEIRPVTLTVRDYVFFNAIFDLFCLVQMAIIYSFMKEASGLFFFFGMIMVGFCLVSIFDYFYERAAGPKLEQVEGN